MNLAKARTQFTQFSSEFQVQNKRDRNLWLLVSRADYTATTDERIIANGFVHLRFNHKFSPVLRGEVFAQWQTNPVLAINKRWLLGAGPRFKVADDKKTLALYLGLAYMIEYTETDKLHTQFEHRNSNYLSFNWQPNKTMSWTTTVYFQPLIANTETYNPLTFNDLRMAGESSLRFKISEHLGFNSAFRFIYNKIPLPNAPDYTYNWTNGFVWTI